MGNCGETESVQNPKKVPSHSQSPGINNAKGKEQAKNSQNPQKGQRKNKRNTKQADGLKNLQRLFGNSQENNQKARKKAITQNKSSATRTVGYGDINSQNEFLKQVYELIIGTPKLCTLLRRELFELIFDDYLQEYWSSDAKAQLISYLVRYLKFTSSQLSTSIKNQTPYAMKSFPNAYGKDLYKLFISVKMKNAWLLQNLEYVENYQKLKFSLKEEKQIHAMAHTVRNMCGTNSAALAFLSFYFVNCCLKLQQEGVGVNKINELLLPPLTKLKEMFSPQKKLQEEMKYNKRSFEENEINKHKSQNFDYKIKKMVFKTQNKQQEIEDLVMEMVALGKKHLASFTQLTSSCCLQNEGFSYKSNLKLKERTEKMPMLRVKEKLLGKKVEQFFKGKKYNSKSIKELEQAQIAYLEECLKKVYQKMTDVEFTVTDILRGKCLFNKLAHINAAARDIIEKVEQRAKRGEDIQIVEIDNRLSKITTDITLKIRIEQIVCEFQIALKFNQAENDIHHKMYEIERSKTYTPVTVLFIWHRKASGQLFGGLKKILDQNTKPDKEKKRLKSLYRQIRQFMSYEEPQSKISPTNVSAKEVEFFQKFKQGLKQIPQSNDLIENADLRTAICLRQIRKQKDAIRYLQKSSKKSPNDPTVLTEYVKDYKGLGDTRKASNMCIKYLQQNIRKSDKKRISFQMLICYGQTHSESGRIIQAKKYLQQDGKKFVIKQFGQKSKQYAIFLDCLASRQSNLGRYKASIEMQEKAIGLFEKVDGGKTCVQYLNTLINLSKNHLSLVALSKSIQVLNKALSVAQDNFGKESLQAAQVHKNYLNIYMYMGKYQQARNYYNKHLSIVQNLRSRQSPEYANALILQSEIEMNKGSYLRSRLIIQKAGQLIQQVYGKESNQYGQILIKYAQILKNLRKYQQVMQVLQYAINLLNHIDDNQQQYSPRSANVFHLLGSAYIGLEEYDDALQCFKKEIQAVQKSTGAQSFEAVSALNDIAIYNRAIGQDHKAYQALKKADQLFIKLGFQNDIRYCVLLMNYGQACIRIEQYQQCQQCYSRAQKIYINTGATQALGYAQLLILQIQNPKTSLSQKQKKQKLLQAVNIYQNLNNPLAQQLKAALDNIQLLQNIAQGVQKAYEGLPGNQNLQQQQEQNGDD